MLKQAQRPLLIIGKGDSETIRFLNFILQRSICGGALGVRVVRYFPYTCEQCVLPGVGAAYGRAENEIKELVELSGLPFLPTPMGKGVLPDDHPNCVSAARSRCVHVWSTSTLDISDTKAKYLDVCLNGFFLVVFQSATAGRCGGAAGCQTKLDPALWLPS